MNYQSWNIVIRNTCSQISPNTPNSMLPNCLLTIATVEASIFAILIMALWLICRELAICTGTQASSAPRCSARRRPGLHASPVARLWVAVRPCPASRRRPCRGPWLMLLSRAPQTPRMPVPAALPCLPCLLSTPTSWGVASTSEMTLPVSWKALRAQGKHARGRCLVLMQQLVMWAML
jgi:hypothetical protein